MSGWAGPLVILGELVALATALVVVLGLAGGLSWLAAQPWTWLLLVGILPLSLAELVRRWPRRPPPARLPPTRLPCEPFCNACGTALLASHCPYCDEV